MSKKISEGDFLYVIGKKLFFDFDEATKHADENPKKQLYRVKVVNAVDKCSRTVREEERVPKEGLKFTDEELIYLKEQLKDFQYLVILNKIDYHGENYIYTYLSTPSYSVAFLDLFKYEHFLALDRSNTKFNTLDEFIDYARKKYWESFYR